MVTQLAVGAWDWAYPLEWDLSPVTGLQVETAEALEWVILLTGEARQGMAAVAPDWVLERGVDLDRALRALRALGSELGQEPAMVQPIRGQD